MKLLYLEDDPGDIELVGVLCEEAGCELVAAGSRLSFILALRSNEIGGVISDSGVLDLPGTDAVALTREMAPGIPFVFLSGAMSDTKRGILAAAGPDGFASKDDRDQVMAMLRMMRERAKKRTERN